jgi:hypothetical protein
VTLTARQHVVFDGPGQEGVGRLFGAEPITATAIGTDTAGGARWPPPPAWLEILLEHR